MAGSRCPAASFPSPPGAAQNDAGGACRAEGKSEGQRGPSFTEESLGGSGPRDERGTVRRGYCGGPGLKAQVTEEGRGDRLGSGIWV